MNRIGKGKGMGKGYYNLRPTYAHDKRVHQMSGKGVKQPQRMSQLSLAEPKTIKIKNNMTNDELLDIHKKLNQYPRIIRLSDKDEDRFDLLLGKRKLIMPDGRIGKFQRDDVEKAWQNKFYNDFVRTIRDTHMSPELELFKQSIRRQFNAKTLQPTFTGMKNKELKKKYKEQVEDAIKEAELQSGFEGKELQELIDKKVREIYKETQKALSDNKLLKEKGIKSDKNHIKLYRGVNVSASHGFPTERLLKRVLKGKDIKVGASDVLTSFTSNKNCARFFGGCQFGTKYEDEGFSFKVKIPKKDIFLSFLTEPRLTQHIYGLSNKEKGEQDFMVILKKPIKLTKKNIDDYTEVSND